MHPNTDKHLHVQNLIEDLEDRNISQERLEEFYTLLRTSPEARQAYWDQINLATILQHEALNLDMQGKLLPLPGGEKRERKKAMVRAFSIAAAAVVLFALITHFILLSKQPTYATYTTSHGATFTISHDTPSDDQPQSSIVAGSRVNLEIGELTVELPGSTTLYIKAPSSLYFNTLHEIELDSGECWVSSNSEQGQLTILSYGFTIEDIGTKFGVLKRENQHPEVHLIEGKVTIDYEGADTITLDEPEAISLSSADKAREIELRYGPFVSPQEAVNIDFAPSNGDHSVRSSETHWNHLTTDYGWPRHKWGKSIQPDNSLPVIGLKNSRGEESPVGIIMVPNKEVAVLNSYSLNDPTRMFGDPLLDDYIHMRIDTENRRNITSSVIITGLKESATYTLEVFSSAKNYDLDRTNDYHDTEFRVHHSKGKSEGHNIADKTEPIVFSGLRTLSHPEYGTVLILDWGWIHNKTNRKLDWAILNGLILIEK